MADPTPAPSPAPVTWEELTKPEQAALDRLASIQPGHLLFVPRPVTDALLSRGLVTREPGRLEITDLGRSVWEEGQR